MDDPSFQPSQSVVENDLIEMEGSEEEVASSSGVSIATFKQSNVDPTNPVQVRKL
jgi:hypothetical protein